MFLFLGGGGTQQITSSLIIFYPPPPIHRMQFFKAALKSWDCLNCCPFSPATGVSLEKDGFVKQLGHWSNTFFVTSLNLWNWLSRHSVRPLVRASVDAGRENNILSCSSTTCCSAAELAEIFFFLFFFFLGELVTVTLNFVCLEHS